MAEGNQVNFTGFRASYANKIDLLFSIYIDTDIFKLHSIVLFHNLTGVYLWLRTQPSLAGPRAQTTNCSPFLKSQSLQVKATQSCNAQCPPLFSQMATTARVAPTALSSVRKTFIEGWEWAGDNLLLQNDIPIISWNVCHPWVSCVFTECLWDQALSYLNSLRMWRCQSRPGEQLEQVGPEQLTWSTTVLQHSPWRTESGCPQRWAGCWWAATQLWSPILNSDNVKHEMLWP